MLPKKYVDSMMCIDCGGDLRIEEGIRCTKCGREFELVGGIPVFLDNASWDEYDSEKDWLLKFKGTLKKHPGFFRFLRYAVDPFIFLGKSRKALLEKYGDDALIIDVGSGPRSKGGRALNLDLYPFPGVDIVADMWKLPFKDGSVDGVINEAVLEHVEDTERVLSEMYRVLKKDGTVYITVPFVQCYHLSPHDYFRWTRDGTEKLLERFEKLEIGLRAGPTSAFLWVFQEWLAMLLSFNVTFLYKILLVVITFVTSPLKLFDLFMNRHKEGHKICATFYYIGRKR